jgi:hypothetical protein
VSDYDGPSESCRVRVLRQLGEIPAGATCDATFYPELKQFMVRVPGHYYNYSCSSESDYVERLGEGA